MFHLIAAPVQEELSKEEELEKLTREYVLGKINIDAYRERSRDFETVLDLRKIAEKLNYEKKN